MTLEEFYAADERRQHSPEWDFGVMWRGDDGRDWPHWRVSWIVETGELYAARLTPAPERAEVIVLGVVPAVGSYPYSAMHEAWSEFKRAQTVEAVMAGWAEGEPHKPLQWVRDRLAQVAELPEGIAPFERIAETEHAYGPFTSSETVERLPAFQGRATGTELAWLNDPGNLARLLRWMGDHDGTEFHVGEGPHGDGSGSGVVEVYALRDTEETLRFLEGPWHWLGELRAMQMHEALRDEREHVPL